MEVTGNHLKKAGQIYPRSPPGGSNCDNKITAFVFAFFSPFIFAFRAFEIMGRLEETI